MTDGKDLDENARPRAHRRRSREAAATRTSALAPAVSEATVLSAFEAATVGITTTELSGRFRRVNPAFCQITGYSANELYGLRVLDLTHPEDAARYRLQVERALAGELPTFVIDNRYVTKAGSWVWARNNVTLVRDAAGEPQQFVTITEDVTDQTRAARRTRRLERVTAALASAITTGDVAAAIIDYGVSALGAQGGAIYRLDEDGTVIELVQAVGYPKARLRGWHRITLDCPCPLADTIRSGQPAFLESDAEWARRYEAIGPLRALPESRAWAALPLFAEGRVLGTIGVSYARHPLPAGVDTPRFDTETRAFMLALSQQFAQALERARLYEAERRARADAEDARAEAEGANAAKSEFLAAMSHEIRTPINAIQGYAQLLELGLAGPTTERQRTFLARLASSSQHLLGLVNDVLDLAKVDAGEMTVAQDRALTGAAVLTALDLTQPLAAARGVQLIDVGPEEPGVAYVGDEHRVRQILVNLLTNAIKFTNPGGTITVRCGTLADTPPAARVHGDGPWAFVQVEDTGIGIAPSDQARVFDAFHQVERGTTRTRGGTGLGLTISRRLARLMGGDLTLDSTPNVGSVFTLWLPAADTTPQGGAEDSAPRATRAQRARAMLTAPGMRELGEFLLASVDRFLAHYVDRLRADPGTPEAKRLRTAELEDHTGTLLSDYAQSLIIVGEAGPDAASLLRDGSAIQRVVAEQHGARRYAQGWSHTSIRRDHEILREVVTEAVRFQLPPDSPSAVDAVGVLFRLLDRATSISLPAWERAAAPGSASPFGDTPTTGLADVRRRPRLDTPDHGFDVMD